MNTHPKGQHNLLRICNGLTGFIGALIFILSIVSIISAIRGMQGNNVGGNTFMIGPLDLLIIGGALIIGPALGFISNHASKITENFSHWDSGSLSFKDNAIIYLSILIGLIGSAGIALLLAGVLSAFKQSEE